MVNIEKTVKMSEVYNISCVQKFRGYIKIKRKHAQED